MPLSKTKSQESFKKNVATEIASGKPQKQAVAIAYSVQREANRGTAQHHRGPDKAKK
jgi:hypothetical protein